MKRTRIPYRVDTPAESKLRKEALLRSEREEFAGIRACAPVYLFAIRFTLRFIIRYTLANSMSWKKDWQALLLAADATSPRAREELSPKAGSHAARLKTTCHVPAKHTSSGKSRMYRLEMRPYQIL